MRSCKNTHSNFKRHFVHDYIFMHVYCMCIYILMNVYSLSKRNSPLSRVFPLDLLVSIYPFICHFQFPASNYWHINTATATTTVSFICMAITIQHCKSVGHTGCGRPTAEKLGQSEKRTSLLASSTGARTEKHSGR